jgi:Bax protein
LLNDRQKLIKLSQKQKLNIREQRWLRHISQNYYNDNFDPENNTHWFALLEKIDIIPVSLALAQAAKESGWGSSRFAREANNYFGQWCYKKGCGLVPKDRDNDASHEVAHYESVKDSVISYIHNLNTNPAYKKFRELRDQLRQSDKAITGYHLADGLQNYSARGLTYVSEIQALIQNNKFGSQHVSR